MNFLPETWIGESEKFSSPPPTSSLKASHVISGSGRSASAFFSGTRSFQPFKKSFFKSRYSHSLSLFLSRFFSQSHLLSLFSVQLLNLLFKLSNPSFPTSASPPTLSPSHYHSLYSFSSCSAFYRSSSLVQHIFNALLAFFQLTLKRVHKIHGVPQLTTVTPHLIKVSCGRFT